MSKVPKTASIPTAVTHYSNFPTPIHHITTANFMECNCAGTKLVVPKHGVKFKMNSFARLKPMQVPTYGGATQKTRAYFVPFRIVMPGFNEFYEDTTFVDNRGQATIPNLHLIRNGVFLQALCDNTMSEFVDLNAIKEDERAKAYDFVVYDNSVGNDTPAVGYRRFTPKGKYLYKLLRSLGYGIHFIYPRELHTDFKHNALPFLCFLRVFYDWYWPSAYADDADSALIKKYLNYADYLGSNNTFEQVISSNDVLRITDIIYRVCYDSDYYVAAWDNPVSPTTGAFSQITINDPTFPDKVSSPTIKTLNDSRGTPAIVDKSSSVGFAVTQYSIDALKAVNDWMKRKQISGARLLDRYLSQWGITLPAEKLARSQYIAESISPVRFGDVTSTADTEGANLGSYAGKGFINNESGLVDFTADEFGMIIIISTVVPNVGYYQGQDRTTMYQSRFDFYQPEFDNLGVQAMSTRELFVPTMELKTEDQRGIEWNDAVFGFVPRYAELKVGREIVSGDILLNSKNTNMEGWSLYRDVSGFYNDPSLQKYTELVHSKEFVQGIDADQYNRIFYLTDNVEDKFIVEHHFEIENRFPGKKLYDAYEFREEDKAQKVEMDVNGVRAN